MDKTTRKINFSFLVSGLAGVLSFICIYLQGILSPSDLIMNTFEFSILVFIITFMSLLLSHVFMTKDDDGDE